MNDRVASTRACALAIGGLDPGGGAGILADLRAFTAADVFGCAVVATHTVQSTSGLVSARPRVSRDVVNEAREVVVHQRVRAIKLGALGSVDNVRALALWLAKTRSMPIVVDPVMLPTRGRGRLLAERAIALVRAKLLPRATLVTANVAEAEALTGCAIASVEQARGAALALCRLGARAALVKGGHLDGERAVDALAVGARVVLVAAPRLSLPEIHGGGCTLAALIAGRLARIGRASPSGAEMVAAVRWAKRVHHAALDRARDVGGAMRVLDHFATR